MAATRGPQVVLEGYARDVARGGGGRTMRENIAAMDALQSAGLVADGSSVDGTSRTGGKVYDPVVAQFPHAPVPAWEIPAPLLDLSVSGGGGGPFLPLTGGTVSGQTTFSAPITVAGNPQYQSANYHAFADTSGHTMLYVAPQGASGNPLTIYSGAAATDPALLRSAGPINMQPGFGGLGGFNIVSNAASSGAAWTELFGVSGQLTGATTAAQTTNVCHFSFTDSLDMSGSPHNLVNYIQLDAQFGGATCRGYRQGIEASLILNTALTVPGKSYVGVVGSAGAVVSAGGTGLTRTTAAGGFFGATFYASTGGTAANVSGVVGAEFDIAIGTGSSALNATGIQVITTATHQVRGVAHWDVGYLLGSQGGAQAIDIGYCIGGSGSQWPVRSDGSLFRGALSAGGAAVARHGINLTEVSFPAFATALRGGAFVSNAFAVDGLGAVQCGPAYLAPASTGATLDVKGSVGTGTPTIAAGGTGYTQGDVLYDGMGGVYLANVTAGAVISVVVYTGSNGEAHQPWCPSHTPPANPVATTPWNAAGASGCTLNLTWDTSRSRLDVQSSGGATTFNGPVTTIGTNGVTVGSGANSAISITPAAGTGGYAFINGVGGNLVIDAPVILFGWSSNPVVRFNSSSCFTANGTKAVSLTALAPAAASATVTEWLTFQDASGTTRYVPCF